MNELPEPLAPVPPIDSVQCPRCGAKLRNVNAEPGAKIRCLNCGGRFDPVESVAAAAAKPITKTLSRDKTSPPVIREPQGAGYWFLRIPAMILLAVTAAGYAFYVVAVFYDLILDHAKNVTVQQFFVGMAYMPLLPLAGYFAFVITRGLARIEKFTLKAAWNAQLIQSSLPLAQGSSLPYILPIAVGPVVIFITMAVSNAQADDYRNDGGVIAVGILGAACFLLAFMVDDFRQFTSRQKAIADICLKKEAPRTGRLLSQSFPWLGVLPALTLISIAITIAVTMYEQRRGNFFQNETEVLMFATIVIGSVAFFLTGRNFKTAVAAWQRAAAATGANLACVDLPALRVHTALLAFALFTSFTLVSQMMRFRPFFMHFPVWVAVLPAVCLLASWALLLARFVHGKKAELRPPTAAKSRAMYFLLAAGALMIPFQMMQRKGSSYGANLQSVLYGLSSFILLAASLAQIYAEVRRWRHAQMLFWRARFPQNIQSIVSKSRLFYSVAALVAFQSIVLSIVIVSDLLSDLARRAHYDWEEIAVIPLTIFAVHFPTIWLALFAREFLMVEEIASRASTEIPPAAIHYS